MIVLLVRDLDLPTWRWREMPDLTAHAVACHSSSAIPGRVREIALEVSGSAGQDFEPVAGGGFLGHAENLQPGGLQLLVQRGGFPVEEPALHARGIRH